MHSLSDKIVVLTGSYGFLGSIMALGLGDLGASLILIGRDASKLEKQRQDLEKKNISIVDIIACDLSQESCLANLDFSHFDRIDALINNAAVPGRFNTNMDSAEMMKALSDNYKVNVIAPTILSFKLAEKMFEDQEKNQYPSIINVGSIYGNIAPNSDMYDGEVSVNPLDYGMSKSALHHSSKYLSMEFSNRGIRVNTLVVGPFPHSDVILKHPDFAKRLANRTSMKRIGSPTDLIGPIAYLISSGSKYMTGSMLVVDGGWLAKS